MKRFYNKEVRRQCPFCGEHSIVEVNEHEYQLWKHGHRIQDVMPDNTSSDREILLSGICKKCQDEMFKDCGFEPL